MQKSLQVEGLDKTFCNDFCRVVANKHSQKLLPWQVTHCGLSGLTAEELLAKQGAPAIRDVCGSVGKGLACMLSEAPQDLVLIMLGTNDLGKGTHPEHIA
eukprot:6467042-Amphidinium_carterae.1